MLTAIYTLIQIIHPKKQGLMKLTSIQKIRRNLESSIMLERTSFNQINRNNKPIVLFGAGNVASKTIEKIEKSKIECIVDNASIMQGKL